MCNLLPYNYVINFVCWLFLLVLSLFEFLVSSIISELITLLIGKDMHFFLFSVLSCLCLLLVLLRISNLTGKNANMIVKGFKMCCVLQHGWSPERESMIPYQMILLNCIGCQLSKGLISRSWSLRIRLSTISHLITSPACSNYGLIPGTSSPHLLHLNLFSLGLFISRFLIVPFHVMHLANGINCLLKSEMLIPSLSSKDFWNLISLNLLMDSSCVSFYCAKAP